MLTETARILDLLFSAFVLGSTVWFFFLQSPALIKWMGRDRFVPIQMRLTKVLFKTLTTSLVAVVLLALVHTGLAVGVVLVGAVVGLLGAVVNTYYVIPRALRAGGKGRTEEKDPNNNKSVAAFASEGSGPSAKLWHRTVVIFVVVMLGGLIPHMAGLIATT